MMSLRSCIQLPLITRQLRHLATVHETKTKKHLNDIHQFNKQSLIVYGPLLGSTPRKRNYQPVYYKESKAEDNFDLIEVEIESDSDLLPILNLEVRDKKGILDLNELLAQPLIPGRGVDPELCRIDGIKSEKVVKLDRMPSVTAILEKTMSPRNRELLEKWKREQIELLGEDGFKEMQRETLGAGRQFHAAVHDFLSGDEEETLEMTSDLRDGLWTSVRNVLDDVNNVRCLEETISHQDLLYSGIVDCVAEYRDTICVIDWKTSKKKKNSLRQVYDNPIQLAAYTGALNSSREMKSQNGVLVYAYPDGSPADVIFVPARKMHYYWSLWLQRLQTYWKMAADSET